MIAVPEHRRSMLLKSDNVSQSYLFYLELIHVINWKYLYQFTTSYYVFYVIRIKYKCFVHVSDAGPWQGQRFPQQFIVANLRHLTSTSSRNQRAPGVLIGGGMVVGWWWVRG